MLLNQNKETTTTLEKLVELISMKTKSILVAAILKELTLAPKQYKIGSIQ